MYIDQSVKLNYGENLESGGDMTVSCGDGQNQAAEAGGIIGRTIWARLP